VKKNIVEPDRPHDNISWLMLILCRRLRYKHTIRIRNSDCFSTAKWLHNCALSFTYIPCLVKISSTKYFRTTTNELFFPQRLLCCINSLHYCTTLIPFSPFYSPLYHFHLPTYLKGQKLASLSFHIR